MIKIAITICANSKKRVLARMGHHEALIKELSKILKNEKIEKIGNVMRKLRNKEMYAGGIVMMEKESGEYVEFVKEVIGGAEIYLNKKIGKARML